MAAAARAAIAPAPRKPLLEWIDHDDGDTTGTTQPACSAEIQALHARLLVAPDARDRAEPLEPPLGLCLAPLG